MAYFNESIDKSIEEYCFFNANGDKNEKTPCDRLKESSFENDEKANDDDILIDETQLKSEFEGSNLSLSRK